MQQMILLVAATLMAFATPSQAPAGVQPVSRVRGLARTAAGTPVVVRGIVTRYRSGRSLAVTDQTASIFAYTDSSEMLAPGDLVEVTGLATLDEELAPCIDKATYRKVGVGEPPAPIPVTAVELSLGRHDADLVSLEGTLQRIEAGRFEYGLVMSAGDIEFIGWVLRDEASTAAAIPPGRRLRLTGAASLKRPTTGPRAFEVLLRSGRDVVMLDPPSWWTSSRVTTAAVALAGAVALLLSYVLLLRRQVNRQTAVIRERLRAETELKEQYRQAQKMESVGRLAGGIAHDFNNIMTVVLGYSDMLGLELQDNPDQMASIKEIQRAAERAAELTRQLLAFGRRSTLQPAVVDLNVVITDIRAMFTRLLGGDIEVVATPADSPVTVMTDRAQLEQALLNLAVNARDAMSNGGRLTMGVAVGQNAAGRPTGLLMVGDTGSGIPEDAQAHVFEPFFTTKDVGQGSGLGLSMVYGFMEQSGGTVRFETVVDHGTTFELAFPLAAPAAIAHEA